MYGYPVFVDLSGKKCLVVGGGPVAERKVRSLLECGARVMVVSPEITAGLKSLADDGKIMYRRGYYAPSDLEGVFLVIGSAGRGEVNRRVADDCAGRNILVNIVDDPAKGNFFVPAVVRRGALAIAVSTGGKSPLLARKIREELEKAYGPQYGEFLDMLGSMRDEVLRSVEDEARKRKILECLVDDTVMGYLKEGRLDLAKERMLSAYPGSGSQPQNGSC
ncbi:siroheme synthase [Pelotomaculum thermopropionicum SI]|uniref:precorrin-2 dehydrogenase n=1 Tax=Pelotomaculum thermopropionicum (strain DSM 13744 / JCM 10971 / SI) TaxID=370438 RepID=A5D3L3_PELTS|nr:siroheme synthase [Pelotomaculum thermopropionicum SI]